MTRARARQARPANGRMNKTEAVYERQLAINKVAGTIESYAFEALKFRLADRTFYTPDFLVITSDGFVELHEVKGFWEDDARVKIKVAAEQFPAFRFVAIQKGRKGELCWKLEEFN